MDRLALICGKNFPGMGKNRPPNPAAGILVWTPNLRH